MIGKRYQWKPTGELDPGESATQALDLPPGEWDLSIQYQSPVVGIRIEAAGGEFELPAAMDGAIPFRFGQGPFWPVGQISSDGGPVELIVRADELSTFQDLIGVHRDASIGNIVATRTDPYKTIPFAPAPGPPCGDYVDSYLVDPAVVKPDEIERLRRSAEKALSGHYQPKDKPENLKHPGRSQ